MPRAPADAKKPKRDPRLRPLQPPVDPWGWIIEDPVRKSHAKPIDHNIHDLQTKPSFYVMVKRALLANKMHYLRGVNMNSIYKYVAANWPVELDTYRRLTRVAIKRALEDGRLELVPGVGNYYRLAAAERPNGQGKEENDEPKLRKGRASANGVVATKRGRTGAAKASSSEESDEESYEAPRKPAKKAAKKIARDDQLRKGDSLLQKGEGKWIWQFLDGNWRDYDRNASDEVEQTFQLYEKEKATGRIIDVRSVRSGTWEYQVDFRQFTQQNIRHESHTIRPIRRVWRAAH